jgi:hypothetical protein
VYLAVYLAIKLQKRILIIFIFYFDNKCIVNNLHINQNKVLSSI